MVHGSTGIGSTKPKNQCSNNWLIRILETTRDISFSKFNPLATISETVNHGFTTFNLLLGPRRTAIDRGRTARGRKADEEMKDGLIMTQ